MSGCGESIRITVQQRPLLELRGARRVAVESTPDSGAIDVAARLRSALDADKLLESMPSPNADAEVLVRVGPAGAETSERLDVSGLPGHKPGAVTVVSSRHLHAVVRCAVVVRDLRSRKELEAGMITERVSEMHTSSDGVAALVDYAGVLGKARSRVVGRLLRMLTSKSLVLSFPVLDDSHCATSDPGMAALRRGDLQSARRSLRACTDAQASDHVALYHLALVELATGRKRAAELLLHRAMELSPQRNYRSALNTIRSLEVVQPPR